ncbi:hypothetical protein pdam_00020742 [Pocillopora damicornis]|uniref:Glycogen debranching enzyme n=1 Tax=Pocillopora damicornis TaxID=46731 RepID=A0A3M6TZU7_POCDA|nr:hypothetical protein pdam_00020742 [Pocillopora damicornis]
MAGQVRVLQLEAGQELETKLFRIEKGWTLRFTLGPSLQPYNVHLLCNHPPSNQQSFDRKKYTELAWTCPPGQECDDADRFADIIAHSAGSFHFYVTYQNGENKGKENLVKRIRERRTTSGYFSVDPVLKVNSSETIPLECVSLQTVLSKSLGPLEEWSDRLRVTKETGYNMIHFTPIQQLGKSNSSYSLLDQLSVNAAFHSPGRKNASFDGVKDILDKMRSEWKVMSIVDVVLNHTANNSPWLWDHPECSYNLDNSPHLKPAFLLDRALWHFTCQVADGLWAADGLPAEVNCEYHIHRIGDILRHQVLPKLQLWELFSVDVAKAVDQFRTAMLKVKKPWSGSLKHDEEPLVLTVGPSYERFSATVDIVKAVAKFNRERSDALDEKGRLQLCCEDFKAHLNNLNDNVKNREVADHIESAIQSVQNTVRYERLNGDGPRHPRVTRTCPLVTRYFTTPGDCDTVEEEEKLMYSNKAKFCMAHPGWIWGGDPLRDFAAPGSFVYFRREVIAWGDSVKLRYGKGPEDVPFLWDYMLKYVKICARVFDGIRLDNCHSTPLHVAEYFVDAARRVEPDLYVTAELFTGSEATDNIFVNRLGITSLIRDIFRMIEYLLMTSKEQTCRAEQKGNNSFEVYFDHFAPGSVIAFDVTMETNVKNALGQLRQLGVDLYQKQSGSQESYKMIDELDDILANLSLSDLNRVLYRADPEERDDGNGGGVYVLPDTGPLVYCGLQVGTWHLGVWLDKVFSLIKECPRYLVPCYFDAIITPLYLKLLDRAWSQMSSFVQNGSSFLKALSLGSLQFVGLSRTASLPALSPQLYHGPSSGADMPTLMSLAAGLPHFSSGFMRCWGRDTFIALRGLLLVTGRYQDARHHILAFAGCIRHGLIPNLLDGGRKPRYNCRDAPWWWLQCIQDYCSIVPDGLKILSEPVSRIFPSDCSDPQPPGKTDQPLYDVIQEVMQRHFNGISFRERGAGPELDNHMHGAGFNVSVGVRESTGFVYGGSQWNAGTWMDKVGESHMAGNFGVPATPRDGSAVEIVGLCKSTVRWLAELCDQKKFPYAGVSKLQDELSYKEWSLKIQNAFEEHFWIPEDPKDKKQQGDEDKLVHRRGIYKDTVGATHRFTDYQFRPNLCVAMVVGQTGRGGGELAPEMFNPENAWKCLDMVEEILLGPLGMATLDPSDWAYEGVYDNSQDSTSYKSAKGFAYHQGPEWLWCTGPFLRARLYFAKKLHGPKGLELAVVRVKSILARHKVEITSSPWRSLPELTNAGGAPCHDGCPAQAWSVGCLLDVLYDMEKLVKDN